MGTKPVNISVLPCLLLVTNGVVFPLAVQNECQVNNGGCSHQCKDMEMGFYCDCPENMKLIGDSQCEGEQRLDGLLNEI